MLSEQICSNSSQEGQINLILTPHCCICIVFFDRHPNLANSACQRWFEIYAFRHFFIVDCRFALLVVDVDFGQKSIVDCRQKGSKTFDLHFIGTPPHPPLPPCEDPGDATPIGVSGIFSTSSI